MSNIVSQEIITSQTTFCSAINLWMLKRHFLIHVNMTPEPYGEMVVFRNNRLTIGAYSNAIQNVYTLLLTDFHHTFQINIEMEENCEWC